MKVVIDLSPGQMALLHEIIIECMYLGHLSERQKAKNIYNYFVQSLVKSDASNWGVGFELEYSEWALFSRKLVTIASIKSLRNRFEHKLIMTTLELLTEKGIS